MDDARFPIDAPDRAHFPPETLAHVFQYCRRCFVEARGGGKNAAHRVGCSKAVLGSLEVRHVPSHGEDQMLCGERHRIPRQPPVGAIPRPKTVPKQDHLRAAFGLGGRSDSGLMIVRMDKLKVRLCHQFFDGEPQRLFPCGIQPFEVAVETGNAKHVQRQVKKPFEIFSG